MTRTRKLLLLTLGSLLAVLLVCAAWTRLRSPESAAKEDAYTVWIAIVKGFEGDVVYIGSDEEHAYFRMGYVFWSYYKLPKCAAKLPTPFAIGNGAPYVVRSQNVPNHSTGCTEYTSDHRASASAARPVSGLSWCREITQARELELKSRTDLKSYRALRDFYADCQVNPGQKQNALLAAARGAAQLGDQDDKEEYAAWQRTFGDSGESEHAP